MPLHFRALSALHAFVPFTFSALTRRTCITHAPFPRALCALIVRFEIFLGWGCSPAKIFQLTKNIKGTTNCAAFFMGQKTAIKLFKGKNFLKIFKKREINSMFFCFSFHLFNDEVINLLV